MGGVENGWKIKEEASQEEEERRVAPLEWSELLIPFFNV